MGVARVLEIGSKLSREQNLTFKTLREALDADESLNSIFNKERSIKKDVDYVSPMEFIKSYIDKAQVTAGTKKTTIILIITWKNFRYTQERS